MQRQQSAATSAFLLQIPRAGRVVGVQAEDEDFTHFTNLNSFWQLMEMLVFCLSPKKQLLLPTPDLSPICLLLDSPAGSTNGEFGAINWEREQNSWGWKRLRIIESSHDPALSQWDTKERDWTLSSSGKERIYLLIFDPNGWISRKAKRLGDGVAASPTSLVKISHSCNSS